MMSPRLAPVSQVPLVLSLTVGFVLYTAILPSTATLLQCRTADDELSEWVQQLKNVTLAPNITSDNEARFQHNWQAHCPSLPTGMTEPGHFSLCPWTYETDSDPNRYPHNLKYARCSCGSCSGPGGRRHRCMPLYQTFHVIERRCVLGVYKSTHKYHQRVYCLLCDAHLPTNVEESEVLLRELKSSESYHA